MEWLKEEEEWGKMHCQRWHTTSIVAVWCTLTYSVGQCICYSILCIAGEGDRARAREIESKLWCLRRQDRYSLWNERLSKQLTYSLCLTSMAFSIHCFLKNKHADARDYHILETGTHTHTSPTLSLSCFPLPAQSHTVSRELTVLSGSVWYIRAAPFWI